MERYLITQSLLSAWAYTFDCANGCEDDAMSSFRKALEREETEPTKEMQNGIDFENLVYAIAAGKWSGYNQYNKWYPGAKKIADILRGAPVQVRASRELHVAGMDFLVDGILDALKAGTIYDVKFLNKSLEDQEVYGKYLHSAQHPAYFYIVPEATDFKYLVSDGDELYIEHYRQEQSRFIGDIISEFIASITSMGLLPLYKEKWLAK